MVWLLSAISAPILWAISNVFDKTLRQNYIKNDLSLTWFMAFGRLPLVVLFFMITGFHVPGAWPTIFLILAGILWTYPFVLYFKAIEKEDASSIIILIQFTPIFTLSIAYFLLGEVLNLPQYFGFVLLLAAGILASFKRAEKKWHFSNAIFLIMLSSFFWAFADVVFKKYAPEFDGFLNAFSFFLLGSFLTGVIILFQKKARDRVVSDFKNLPSHIWIYLFSTQVLGIAGSLIFSYALTIGKASLTSVVLGIQPLLVLVLSFLMGKILPDIEKEDFKKENVLLKIIAIILVILGLALL